jgi:hypothetical protein
MVFVDTYLDLGSSITFDVNSTFCDDTIYFQYRRTFLRNKGRIE